MLGGAGRGSLDIAGSEVVAHCLDQLTEIEVFVEGRVCVINWKTLANGVTDVRVESNFDSGCDKIGCVLEYDVDDV